ncbi:MAG: hypothetical protein AAFR17_09910 [Pseudomonadota bacterium]
MNRPKAETIQHRLARYGVATAASVSIAHCQDAACPCGMTYLHFHRADGVVFAAAPLDMMTVSAVIDGLTEALGELVDRHETLTTAAAPTKTPGSSLN